MYINVSGASGFIGKHVVYELEARGHDVNKTRDIDAMIHLDAWANVEGCHESPTTAVERNVVRAAECAADAIDRGAKKIIYASTTSIYAPTTAAVDSTAKEAPVNIYALTKWQGGQVMAFMCLEHKVDFIELRLPNIYGPGQTASRARGVIAKWMSALAHGEFPVTFSTAMENRRDYVYVKDVANVFADVVGPSKLGDIAYRYRRIAATGRMTSTGQLLGMVCDVMGVTDPTVRIKKSDIDFHSPDHGSYRADYLCPTTLEDGLLLTAQWWKEQTDGHGIQTEAQGDPS